MVRVRWTLVRAILTGCVNATNVDILWHNLPAYHLEITISTLWEIQGVKTMYKIMCMYVDTMCSCVSFLVRLSQMSPRAIALHQQGTTKYRQLWPGNDYLRGSNPSKHPHSLERHRNDTLWEHSTETFVMGGAQFPWNLEQDVCSRTGAGTLMVVTLIRQAVIISGFTWKDMLPFTCHF